VDRLGLSVRLLALLLIVSLPPLIAFGAVVAFGGDPVARIGRGTLFAFIGLLGFAWAGVVAVIASRTFGREIGALLDLAERGDAAAGSAAGEASAGGEGYRRLASLLAERDRQMRELASEIAAAPVSEDLGAVARHVVKTCQRVTGDETWTLAVLNSPEKALKRGVYGPGEGPRPLEDLHSWATTAAVSEEEENPPVRLVQGPWGAFVVVDVTTGGELRAILLAPWEGRPEPTPVERSLVTLLAQHAATAIEHALLYTRLRQQTDELTRLAGVQADFLRGVTHDLQTPLTSISALASELRDGKSLRPEASGDLEAIGYQADRMRRMVSQLLTMSGLEAGAIKPRREVFRVEPIVRRVWSSLRAERGFELMVEGPDRLAVGDPDRFEQALWAVLDNAVKYSPAGSSIAVGLTCRPATPADRAGKGLVVEEVSVTDHGVGMDPETAAHAFDRFYRSDAARRLAPDGSGVGLYTASQLLTLMGGHISASSAPGSETTVRIVLPAEPAGAD
jgi:signal transduction histidine kinase